MPRLGSMPDPKDKPRTLLLGWISRLDLAVELGLSIDTLRRWEAQRIGPPSVRAGRKVYYRRAAVEEWLEAAGAGRPAPPPCRRAPVMHLHPRNSDWPAARLAEARAVIADVAHHSDHLIRLACNVLVAPWRDRRASARTPGCCWW